MKKVISAGLILVICLGLVSCTSGVNTLVSTEPPLSACQIAIQTALAELRNTMKNPDSFQVHSVEYVDTFTGDERMAGAVPTDFTYIFKIDYSAQNGFGGMNRKTIYVTYYNENDFAQDVKNSDMSYLFSEPKSSVDISELTY